MKVRSQRALRQLKKWRSYVLVVASAYALMVIVGALLGPVRTSLENLVFDQYQRWKPRPYDFNQPIRIIDIDDESIHLIGRWPWSRQTMAALVEALAKANVAAIGFDFLFSEQDRASAQAGDCASAADRGADAVAHCQERGSGDTALAHSIQGRPVVLGVFLMSSHNGSQASLTTKAGFSFVGDPPNNLVTHFNGALAPISELADASQGLGFLNWLPDNDRVVRRVPLLLDVNAAALRSPRASCDIGLRKTRNVAMMPSWRPSDHASRFRRACCPEGERRRRKGAPGRTIWPRSRRNPLKSLDSDERIQANPPKGGERGAYGTKNRFSCTPKKKPKPALLERVRLSLTDPARVPASLDGFTRRRSG